MAGLPTPLEVDMDAILALPEAERREELAKAQVLQRVLQENPLWRWMPHAGELDRKRATGLPVDGSESRGQVEFLERGAHGTFVVAAVAGNRFGKTEVGVIDAAVQTLPRELLPPWLLPYKRLDPSVREVQWRFVGVDLGNWLKKAMLPKVRRLVPKAALRGGDFGKAWNDKDRQLHFKDGSWWDFLTHDMDLDSFASADLDGITYDEEPPGALGEQQWEEGLGRLVDRAGVVRCTMTPLLGLSWMYRELSDGVDKPRRDDDVWVVTGSIDDNPHLDVEGKRRAVERWEAKDPLRAQARRHGRWVHFEGLIFPDFSRDRHIVPDRPVPVDEDGKQLVLVVEGLDPGIDEKHPAGYLLGFVDEQDVLEIAHAHLIFQGTAADMSAHVHDTRAALGVRPQWTVIDPSARNRNHQTGRSVQDEYRKHRVFTLPGQNSRLASYNAITERLRDGRLRVQASAAELLAGQFENYRWKRPRGRSDDAPTPGPVKIDDDLIDPLRYMVMQLPGNRARPEPLGPVSGAQAALEQNLRRLARGGRRARVGGVIA
jgi:phage terminase large subunit-like protein